MTRTEALDYRKKVVNGENGGSRSFARGAVPEENEEQRGKDRRSLG